MNANRLIHAIENFAGNVLKHARPYPVPLLIDQPDCDGASQGFRLLSGREEYFVLSNFSNQQELMRLLAGLTMVTGEQHYLQAAKDVVGHMFEHFADSSGLLGWGGHTAVALPVQEPAFERGKGAVHELKCNYPYYDLMWEVDPDATKRFIEAFWNAHVEDWTTLDFNRHGTYMKSLGKVWLNPYTPKPVFFWGSGLTFVNTGSDLYYAASVLSRLTDEDAPLLWAERLANRYIETRQTGIGISGYQFSQCAQAWCNGPEVKGDRAQYQYAPYLPDGHLVYEGTLFRPLPVVQRCQLYLGATLGMRGEQFLTWALEEMIAWGRVAYRKQDNSFIPMLTDGYLLEGFTMQRDGYFGPEGSVESARFASPDYLWMYACGYRHSKDEFLWQMIRNIAAANGLGDIGEPGSAGLDLCMDTEAVDYRIIHGLLELYRSTNNAEFLRPAYLIAENILNTQYRDGWFMTDGKRVINSPASLAVLHLAAAMLGNGAAVPECFR
jgi:pectate lyase